MFSKKNRNNQMVYPQPYYDPYNNMYQDNYDLSRLDTEISELRRQQQEILKRLSKVENYLGIRNEDHTPLF